jgi:hypothetical protein
MTKVEHKIKEVEKLILSYTKNRDNLLYEFGMQKQKILDMKEKCDIILKGGKESD